MQNDPNYPSNSRPYAMHMSILLEFDGKLTVLCSLGIQLLKKNLVRNVFNLKVYVE